MDTPTWVTQREASFALSTSERTLARLRSDGHLPVGLCWRRKVPTNKNSHCLYNLEACIDVLSGQAKASQMEEDKLSDVNETEVVNT